MNEDAALEALAELLRDNNEKLVSGLIFGGAQRYIATISETHLTPPSGYFHIALNVTQTVTEGKSATAAIAVPRHGVLYNTQVFILDIASVSEKENFSYEIAHKNFRVFSDRVVTLLKDQKFITNRHNDLKFRIDRRAGADQRIQKTNRTRRWSEQSGYMAALVALLSFDLSQECLDDAKLY